MSVFAEVYITGSLPIKKYKTESDLNNFMEYSMVNPRNMAQFFGFTIVSPPLVLLSLGIGRTILLLYT